MTTEAQSILNTDPLTKLNKRLKRLSVSLLILSVLLIVFAASVLFLFWRKARAIDKAQEDLRFSQFVTEYANAADFVQPQVNTIQFLRRGYSITFDSVQYTQDGLVLSGSIGNPTQLWISALALHLTARPYPYKIRDKWAKSSFPWWDADWNIGSGQTTVGFLNPGASVPFHVTIPNVKQTSDNIEIAVSFSGERYQYLGK